MSEVGKSQDKPQLPNKVAEYVLSSVPTNRKLNAHTLQDADSVFKSELVAALKKADIGKKFPLGSTLISHPIENDDRIVVKRVSLSSVDDVNESWLQYQQEHQLIEKYFGRRFVPYTEFVIVDGILRDNESGLLDNEHVLIQERVTGEEYDPFSRHALPQVSPQLKDEMVEFIKRYEHMTLEAGVCIDDQIMVDYANGKIKVFDTNNLTNFNIIVQNAARGFFEAFHIDPTTIQTPQDIMRVFGDVLPDFASLRGADYNAFLHDSRGGKNTACSLSYQYLSERFIDQYDVRSVGGAFNELVSLLQQFAPEGYHNEYIQYIMKDFGISDIDLSQRSTETK